MKDKEIVKKAEELIRELLSLLSVTANVSVAVNVDEAEEKYVHIEITGEDLGGLIGYRGNTLNAVQVIFSQMMSKEVGEIIPILIDVNDFRKRRAEYLKSLAQRAAREATESNQDVELPPLSPYERRIIHLTLKNEEGVVTESKGEGDERRVVVKIDVKE